MNTDIKLILLARKHFDNVIFDPFKNHIISYEKDLYYESSIWGAVFFESFVYFYIIARLFSHQRIKSYFLDYSRYIDNVSGVVFIGFGLFLIYSAIKIL